MTKESLEQLHQRALDFVLQTYNSYKQREDTEQKWVKYDKLYNCISDKRTYQGVANLFPPATRRAVRSLLNFCDESLFGRAPSFSIKGIGGDNDNKRAKINEKIIHIQMEKIGFRNKVRTFLEKAIIKGTAVCKVSWNIKEKYVIAKNNERKSLMKFIKNFITGQQIPDFVKEKISVYDCIDFVNIDLENIYWDFYRKWDEQEAIIEKQNNITNSSLLLLEKTSNSYFGIKEYLEENPIGIELEDKTADSQHTSEIVGATDNLRVNKQRHQLLECWCNFDIDNDGIDEECVITVIDEKQVIRCELNPYDIQEKPYLLFKWEDIDKAESIGQGAVALAENSQLALNDHTNQLMDNITMCLNAMMVVDAQAGISKIQLKSRPGGIITSNTGTQGIDFIRPPNVTASALRAIEMTKNDIMETTGATANLQGLPARYDTTAQEAALMSNSSQRDLFVKLRSFEDCVLKQFLRKAYGYNLQYLSSNEIKRIIGSEAFSAYLMENSINPEDDTYNTSEILLGDYDFIPLAVTETENKIIKGQQLMNLYNMALHSPQGIWNIREIAKKIACVLNDGDISIIEKELDTTLFSPQDENILMSQGEQPYAKPQENHSEHIRLHSQLRLPESYQQIRIEHINQHLKFLQMQQAEQQALQQQELLRALVAQAALKKTDKKEIGLPEQEQPVFAPKGITPQQAGQVPGVVNPPAALK